MARKGLQRLAAHPAGGAVGKNYARILFQPFQLVVVLIVLAVGHGGVVEHVIFVRPFIEFIHKFAHSVHN